MESKNNAREEETTSMEAKSIVFGYNGDPKHPEETVTETVISTNQSKSTTTKRYKGVWKKNGKWIAQIRNPNTNSRVVLGSFHSCAVALFVYSSKKYEFESLMKDAEVTNMMMIDNNGFLLGDFNRLDNELRIC